MHSRLIKPTDIIRDGIATALVALSILYPSAEKPSTDEHQTKAASVDVTPHEKRQPAGIAITENAGSATADSPAAKPEAEGHEAPTELTNADVVALYTLYESEIAAYWGGENQTLRQAVEAWYRDNEETKRRLAKTAERAKATLERIEKLNADGVSGAQSAHLIEPEPAPLPEVILPRPEIQATYLAACKEAARTREVLIVTYTDEQQRGRAVDWLNRTEAARRFVWLLEPGEANRVQIHDVVSQKSRRVSKPSDLEE